MNSIPDEYRSHLHALGHSPKRIAVLVGSAMEFLDHTRKADLGSINREDVEAFYAWLHIRPKRRGEGTLGGTMILGTIRALRTFLDYLEGRSILTTNPMSVMRFRPSEQAVRIPLAREEMQRLYEVTVNLRERALLHIVYGCGLRRAEAERLDRRDVQYRQQVLYVREGKGAKRRVVPMTARIARDLRAYDLRERKESESMEEEEPFLLNARGRRLSADGWYRMLKTLVHRAGIEREVTLHHLRHSIATHLLESGLPLERVRDFLGHRHLEATQVYTKVHKNQLGKL